MTTRRAFLVKTALFAAAAGGVWWGRDRLLRPVPPITGPQTGTWLPFAAARTQAPVVSVGLAGRTVRALVDSGAQASAIDAGFAAEAGLATFPLPIIAYGAGGKAVAGRGAHLEVTLGDMVGRSLRAAVLDLGMLARPEGLGVPLVLGQDLLTALVVEIDYPGRRLRFHQAEAFAAPAEAEVLPTRREGRALYADLQVEQTTVAMMVDTGASAPLAVRSDTAQEAGLLDGRPMRRARAMALGGVVEGGQTTVERARLGEMVFDGAEIHVFPAAPNATPLSALIPQLPAGLLGSGAFRDDRVALDLSRGRLYRWPRAATTRRRTSRPVR